MSVTIDGISVRELAEAHNALLEEHKKLAEAHNTLAKDFAEHHEQTRG